MKSLKLRWEHSSQHALIVAKYLEEHSRIKRVLYPGLTSHLQFEIARRQFTQGHGSVVSFELKKCTHAQISAFVDAVIANGRIVFGESLASPETILSYPAIMSHRSLPKKERVKLAITEGFFRLSIGFDSAEEIIKALKRALKKLD